MITHTEAIWESEMTRFSFLMDEAKSKDAKLFYFGIWCGWWYLTLDIIPENTKLFMIAWEKKFFTMPIAFIDFG